MPSENPNSSKKAHVFGMFLYLGALISVIVVGPGTYSYVVALSLAGLGILGCICGLCR